jgi:hypothetical protein
VAWQNIPYWNVLTWNFFISKLRKLKERWLSLILYLYRQVPLLVAVDANKRAHTLFQKHTHTDTHSLTHTHTHTAFASVHRHCWHLLCCSYYYKRPVCSRRASWLPAYRQIHTHTLIHTHTHTHTYTHTHTHTDIHTLTCTHKRTYLQTYCETDGQKSGSCKPAKLFIPHVSWEGKEAFLLDNDCFQRHNWQHGQKDRQTVLFLTG